MSVAQLVSQIPRSEYYCLNKPFYGWAQRVPVSSIAEFDTIGINTRSFLNVITVDIDSPNALMNCVDLADYDSRLMPNFVISNRVDDRRSRPGHGHAVYVLDEPINKSHSTGYQWSRDLVKRVNAVFPDADPGYANHFLKNPLNPRWHVTVLREQAHSTRDLSSILPSLTYQESHQRIASNDVERRFIEGSRNNDVFVATREWAFSEWTKYRDGALYDAIYSYAALMNSQCRPPLPDQEIKSLAKSITGYCLRNHPVPFRTNPNWNFGVLKLKGTGITRSEACRAGQKHTCKVRVEKTTLHLRETRLLYPNASQVKIAELSGVSRRSVNRYWSSTAPVLSVNSSCDIPASPVVIPFPNPSIISSSKSKHHYYPDSQLHTPCTVTRQVAQATETMSLIRDARRLHPDASQGMIAKTIGRNRDTVNKYWKSTIP